MHLYRHLIRNRTLTLTRIPWSTSSNSIYYVGSV